MDRAELPTLFVGIIVGWCASTRLIGHPDVLLVLESGAAIMLGLWTLRLGTSLIGGWRLERGLRASSIAASHRGIRYRRIVNGGLRAFVLGALRPTIYLADGLEQACEPDELEAVLLHEEHHRRTLAPLRAAGLDAWLALLGRSGRARQAIEDRLADLERLADLAAISRGARPATLASALLKAGDPSARRCPCSAGRRSAAS